MTDVSLLRLYLLRATYLLMAVGIAFTIWPQLLNHPTPWPLWHGVGCSLLGAIGVLSLLGIRYPLKMLPLLFFEMTWKVIWMLTVAVPLWTSHKMDAVNLETAQNCAMGIIIPLVLPWSYIWSNYIKMPGNRWR